MKIALCHESVCPRRGGCETYVARLARRLVAEGHEAHLYACEWDDEALPPGLSCHRIWLPPLPRAVRPWAFSAACAKRLARGGHDVSVGFDKAAGVDVYYPQGGLYAESALASLRKHPGAMARRALAALRWLDVAHLSFLALERRQLARPGALLVAISGLVRRQVERHFPAAAGRVRLLPIAPALEGPGPDEGRRRERARRRWGLAPDQVVALFAGMNYRLKGLAPLLGALARAPGLALVVAGAPGPGGFLRLARRLGVADRTRFVGYCADMRDAYAAADFLAHPTFYDPCSNVVLEALACGLPVVTSRHNGASELLTPAGEPGACAEGYVIDDPHDVARLAECLRRLADAARREECARAARRASRAWTFEGHFRGLMAILGEAARARLDRAA
jgi:UDP-glucose:(heptosyl)LPS alpha-1,3-glucosyltransferase